MQYFKWSLIVTLVCFSTAYWWGGFSALIIAMILAVLEISLSFDNAVVNATVLKKMNKKWQERFLTWGIFIAVFVVRLLLPLMIVSLTAHLNIKEVAELALHSPTQYAQHLMQAHASIATFGGLFLLLVFLSFLFSQQRQIHWLGVLEKKLNQMGKLDVIEILIALLVLLGISNFVDDNQKMQVMVAGLIGIILFMSLNSLTKLLNNHQNAKLIKRAGLMNFIYLEILDTSFSLDGIIGAFAITKDIVIILLGLAVGAMFVRSLTIFLIYKNTLSHYRFLEHGAHYAVGALSILMLMSLFTHVPEIITGFIGVGVIGLAMISSLRYNRLNRPS
jgi:hypothetical protein